MQEANRDSPPVDRAVPGKPERVVIRSVTSWYTGVVPDVFQATVAADDPGAVAEAKRDIGQKLAAAIAARFGAARPPRYQISVYVPASRPAAGGTVTLTGFALITVSPASIAAVGEMVLPDTLQPFAADQLPDLVQLPVVLPSNPQDPPERRGRLETRFFRIRRHHLPGATGPIVAYERVNLKPQTVRP